MYTSRSRLALVSLVFVSLPVSGCAQGRFSHDLRVEDEEFPYSVAQPQFSNALQDPSQDYHHNDRDGSIGPYHGDLYRLGS